jgi:tetratricopeptide (TPR) repeat protein
MNSTPLLLLSVCLATGAGVATSYVLRASEPVIGSEAGASAEELSFLRSELMRLGDELETLQSSKQARQLPAARGADRFSSADIDSAVQRYFSEQQGQDAFAAAEQLTEGKGAAFKVSDVLDKLRKGGLNEEQRVELWKQVREAGKMDELVALYEAEAEANPNDPDAQVEAAQAYLQKIFEVGDGPEAGLWAAKADSAYDRALELNPEHWSARFSKAVSLSFWPPIFGKQQEAISQFEHLIGQQKAGPLEDRHAQSYFLLGNLYSQTGQMDKAQSTWQQGLVAFPNDTDLLSKFGE